jgi:hypothetical protein
MACCDVVALRLAVASSTESSVNHASIGLRPDLILSQMGRQLSEIERSVDVLTLYVLFNLGKLLNESLAVLVKILAGTHA